MEERSGIEKWIASQRNSGMDRSTIINQLVNQGWTQNEAEQVVADTLSDHTGEETGKNGFSRRILVSGAVAFLGLMLGAIIGFVGLPDLPSESGPVAEEIDNESIISKDPSLQRVTPMPVPEEVPESATAFDIAENVGTLGTLNDPWWSNGIVSVIPSQLTLSDETEVFINPPTRAADSTSAIHQNVTLPAARPLTAVMVGRNGEKIIRAPRAGDDCAETLARVSVSPVDSRETEETSQIVGSDATTLTVDISQFAGERVVLTGRVNHGNDKCPQGGDFLIIDRLYIRQE